MKTAIVVILSLAVGIILGTALDPLAVKAQGLRSVYINEVPLNKFVSISGSNVVGFSCVVSAVQNSPHCYIASQ